MVLIFFLKTSLKRKKIQVVNTPLTLCSFCLFLRLKYGFRTSALNIRRSWSTVPPDLKESCRPPVRMRSRPALLCCQLCGTRRWRAKARTHTPAATWTVSASGTHHPRTLYPDLTWCDSYVYVCYRHSTDILVIIRRVSYHMIIYQYKVALQGSLIFACSEDLCWPPCGNSFIKV